MDDVSARRDSLNPQAVTRDAFHAQDPVLISLKTSVPGKRFPAIFIIESLKYE